MPSYDALRIRLLAVAAFGLGGAACGKPDPAQVQAPLLPPEASATPATVTSTTTSVVPGPKGPTTGPQAVTCEFGQPQETCFPPRTNARAVGTGEPGPAPPPSAFDANGCLPRAQVTNGCCNPAVTGPEVREGKCCYTFCTGSCCGRPFVVDGQARVAPLRPSRAWADPAARGDAGSVDSLAAETRRALAGAWAEDALMEHASVAAFGRFVLQLLALGAPPDLLRDASTAAADEVEHARLCFQQAARFGDAEGPGPLPIDGAIRPVTLADVAAAVVEEGCVGETLSALVASRQLEGATDRATRETLERIAADEARHAELAWRFVRWALEEGGAPVRARVATAFDGALRALDAPRAAADLGAPAPAAAWAAFGRLSPREHDEATRRGLSEVVAPCARALLASDASVGPELLTHDHGTS